MDNKLNGLTLNQAELLLLGLRKLSGTLTPGRDRIDRDYLMGQLDLIIDNHWDELELTEKDITSGTK